MTSSNGTLHDQWDGFAERRRNQSINVGNAERWVSAIGGLAIIAVGFRKPRWRRALWPLGTSLVGRALTGRCPVNRLVGRNSAQRDVRARVARLSGGGGTRIERSVIVARSPEDLFQFWRNFTNLPRFMDNLEAVTVLDEDRSHWIAKGPAGARVEWDAAIHNEIEDELIAWRSLPGSDVDQAGSVHFIPTGDGMTEVRVVLRYRPRAGKLGETVTKLLGEDPAQQIADDLRRFKQVVEAV
jgi:uncharacterized membrane protein